MKKAITGSLALLVSVSILISGCGSSANTGQPQQGTGEETKVTVMKLAHVNPKDSPVGEGLISLLNWLIKPPAVKSRLKYMITVRWVERSKPWTA